MHDCDTDPRHIATDGSDDADARAELNFLSDVVRLLPAGVTVQDENGRFVLMNDAAAAQLGISDAAPLPVPPHGLESRREVGLGLLRDRRALVTEEAVRNAGEKQILLTTHQPVRISDRSFLLSSSADISDQKAF